jgi:thioredoxin reductase
MHDIIILGGGAAGLAAAAYGLNKQLDVVLIAEEIGGKAGTQQRLRGQAGSRSRLRATASKKAKRCWSLPEQLR